MVQVVAGIGRATNTHRDMGNSSTETALCTPTVLRPIGGCLSHWNPVCALVITVTTEPALILLIYLLGRTKRISKMLLGREGYLTVITITHLN